jgi:hypothetical protein
VRHLRLINLLHFAQLLAFDDLKEFWNLFQAQDPNRFGQLLASIRDRVSRAPYDQRSVQVLIESLDWASRHPDAVLDPFGEGDAPNFVAFTALFDHLHQFHKQYGHMTGAPQWICGNFYGAKLHARQSYGLSHLDAASS